MKTGAINRLVYTFTIVTVLLTPFLTSSSITSSPRLYRPGRQRQRLPNELRSSMLNEKVFDSVERLLTESVVSDYWKDISFFVAGDWQNSLVRVKNTHTFLVRCKAQRRPSLNRVDLRRRADAELSSLSGSPSSDSAAIILATPKSCTSTFPQRRHSGWHYDTGTGVVSYSILYPLVGHVYHPQGIISVQLRGNASAT